MKKIGKQTIQFEHKIGITGSYSIVGPKEGNGNFAKFFHQILSDDLFGQDSYEKAERKMFLSAVLECLKEANMQTTDIDVLIGGDLMNQIISSNFAARELQAPFLGVFGACSTMVEGLIVASTLVDGNGFNNVVCVTGSHFSTAEKQFRYPLELGTQRPPTSQWTVTGAGATIVSSKKSDVKIVRATIGKVVDWNVCDVNNMGGAMAPAALETLYTFFEDTKTKPCDYDLILTGDLGKMGSEILRDLMEYRGYKLESNYGDCGQMIFSNNQKVFQGGSGCGCVASVFNSYVIKRLKSGDLKKVLVVATGALMNTLSSQQGDSIPCIAHLIELEGKNV